MSDDEDWAGYTDAHSARLEGLCWAVVVTMALGLCAAIPL